MHIRPCARLHCGKSTAPPPPSPLKSLLSCIMPCHCPQHSRRLFCSTRLDAVVARSLFRGHRPVCKGGCMHALLLHLEIPIHHNDSALTSAVRAAFLITPYPSTVGILPNTSHKSETLSAALKRNQWWWCYYYHDYYY